MRFVNIRSFWTATVVAIALAAWSSAVPAQAQADDAAFDPVAVLGAAKAASGGSAWNDLVSQHSHVTLSTAGISGPVERWSELKTGRSYLTYTLGPITGAIGFDGTRAWTQDGTAQARFENGRTQRELAVNTAYRDQLAFWFPQRRKATITAKGRESRDGARFFVIGITPEGGREFDLWVNAETNLIERLVEREASATRTEQYMDFRDVGGVKIPFRVRATRGNPRFDEVVTVDSIAYDEPTTKVAFAPPAAPAADYVFPAGKPAVEMPVVVRNGHMYIRVLLNGRGPFLMLFDSGGANVLFPDTVKALGLTPDAKTSSGDAADLGVVKIDAVDVGGVRLANQVFATLGLADQLQRIEGVDNVAGLIGYELFKRMPTRIDYARQRVTFYDPATYRYTGAGTPVSLQFRGQMPQVDGSLDGVDGVFDLDTGSRSSLTVATPFASDNKLADKYKAGGTVIVGAGVGGPARAQLARAGQLKLGGVTVDKPVALLSTATEGAFADPTLAGNVGYGVLRRFNLVFDFPNQVAYFERTASDAEPDSYDRSGVWVERNKDGYVLVDVLDGGPAATAGLATGTIITAVDGVAIAKVPLDEFRLRLRGAAGTKVKLTDKGGKSYVVTLRDLV